MVAPREHGLPNLENVPTLLIPDMEVFITPKLDKSPADQISSNYKKNAENRDKELPKVQRYVLNTAASLTVLHDMLENNWQAMPNDDMLNMIKKSLCL